jgi:hypothetical protein
MDEHQWLTGTGPKWMLEHVRPHVSPRKLRLFTCASLHRVESVLAEPAGLRAVQAVEALADGTMSHPAALGTVQRAISDLSLSQSLDGFTGGPLHVLIARSTLEDPWAAAQAYAWLVAHSQANGRREEELAAQCDLLRCLFGNPFRPVPLQPEWLTGNGGAAHHLARVIDDEQRFAEMPILADALEEAGCSHPDVLNHCRQHVHARGCWVLDLLLGRA